MTQQTQLVQLTDYFVFLFNSFINCKTTKVARIKIVNTEVGPMRENQYELKISYLLTFLINFNKTLFPYVLYQVFVNIKR